MNVILLTSRKFPTNALLILTTVIVLFTFPLGFAEERESLETIRSSAQEHVLEQIAGTHLFEASATANALDARLQLKRCDKPLATESTGTANSSSRMTVRVSCQGSNPWALYVPVTVSALVDVVFSRRALARGMILAEEDLELRRISLDKLPVNYLSDSNQLLGFELTRAVNSGTPLAMNVVKLREIVRQGQEVIIVAQASGFQVRMSGKALKNGTFGDLIPVQNLKSGRTIEATVVGENRVSVNL